MTSVEALESWEVQIQKRQGPYFATVFFVFSDCQLREKRNKSTLSTK